MSSDNKKRTIADLWSCCCCLGTLEDNCIPAVMNCQPFAHAICVGCADKLLEAPPAKCPKCQTAFTFVRPLVEFVDTDNEAVASALAKKAKKESAPFQQNLAAVLATIDNNVVQERVKFLAERTKTTIEHLYARGWYAAISGSDYVPQFDRNYVRIRVTRKGVTRVMLQALMERLTNEVVGYVQPLFPNVKIEPWSNPDEACRYLWIRVARK